MLRHTFIHLPGIGPQRERWLWDHGCHDWQHFLTAAEAGELPGRTLNTLTPLVRQSAEALAVGDARFFGARMASRESWRLYPDFAQQALFLDIETTGLSPYDDEVTVIGTLGGGQRALFINGVNLHAFPAYAARFPLLITFNGSQFDVPFLRVHFPQARLDQAHIDLRFVLASLGFKGGLKAVERNLGIHRDPAIQDVDGFEAVRLWHAYRRGSRAALEKLLLYNVADVMNMVALVELAVTRKIQQLPLADLNSPAPRAAAPPSLEQIVDWVKELLASVV